MIALLLGPDQKQGAAVRLRFNIPSEFPGCSTPEEKVSFLPQWSPQAQFAGYYTAYEKGFYKKYGIDLTIITGGPDKQALDWLEKGKADFATAWLSTALRNRSRGVKLVNVAQLIERSALMLVARKSSGISKPEDLNGKRVSTWGGDFAIRPSLFFKKYDLKVENIPQAYSLNLFLRGGVDAASAMWYNEYPPIIDSGINPDELSTIFYYDYGLNFPEDGIYTLEETFSKNPGAVRAFVKASIEGWLYAFSHSDEALDIVLDYMKTAEGMPADGGTEVDARKDERPDDAGWGQCCSRRAGGIRLLPGVRKTQAGRTDRLNNSIRRFLQALQC